MQLYEDFAKSQAKREVEDSLVKEGGEREEARPTTHVFQVRWCVLGVVVSHIPCSCDGGYSIHTSLIPRPLNMAWE